MKQHISFRMVAALASVASCSTLLADPHPNRPIGDSQVIATVQFPGYPEGIAVKDGKIYVAGPAAFGVAGNFVPSTIQVFDEQTGAPLKTITIQGQPPSGLHALSCIAADDEGNLYVLDEQQGVVKINAENGHQSIYAGPFPVVFKSSFSPAAPQLLNDLAFDKKGFLYITDSFEATIWRVPPGGGAPQAWYSSAAIDGIFGPNGLRVNPDSTLLFIDVTFHGDYSGTIYTLPLVDHPKDADLKVFHSYPYVPGQAPAGPDGFAFGKSGKLYVCLAGASQISVLLPDGSEERRLSGPARTSDPANPLPWANPANIAFNDETGSLLVNNHASLTGLPDPSFLFAVFDVYVNDRAAKLFSPHGDE